MDSKKKEISVIGAAIMDVLACPVTEKLFQIGSLPMDDTKISFGGDALNETIVLTRLNKNPELISKVGDDNAGHAVLQYCRENGVDVERVTVEKGLTTGTNIVLVDEKGERYFLTNPRSSLRTLSLDDIEKHMGELSEIVSFASIFVSEKLRIPEMTELFARIKEKPSRILCADMTKAKHGERLEDLKLMLPYVDYLFPNESEISLVTGETDCEKNARLLLDAGVKCVVIKQGAKGCLIRTEQAGYQIPAYPRVACVDTTGAGDTFAASFMWALSEGYALEECGRFSCAAASIAVESLGAVDGIHSLEQVMTRYQEMPEAVRL